MADLHDYWRRVCAPKLLAQKRRLGRGVPEHEIASFVESRTGQDSSRGLVSLWLHGLREPTVSQFIALCEKLEVVPLNVMAEETRPARVPLARVAERSAPYAVRKTRSVKKQ